MTLPRRRQTGRISGENVVVECAWMYYEEGLNQKEIADRLGISRATVVNYLSEARARGLVRIQMAAEAFTTHRLARDLCSRYGLAAAYVIPDEGLEVEPAFARVVRGAASWLPRLLAPGDRLGLAWGRTIHDLAEAVERQTIDDLMVLQLVGSMATPYGFSAEACSTRLAEQLGARCLNLHAPAILSRAELAAELRAEPIIARQLEALGSINKVLFSVGTVSRDSHVVLSGVATEAELDHYVAQGAAGVLCGRFIDGAGRPIAGPLEERMIGITPDALVGLEMGVLVTPGHDKIAATRAAISGGYVTHLVTGLTVAEALLE
jgi:deoxyribonucleoside regulator